MRDPADAKRDFVRDWIAKAENDLAAARALVVATLDDYGPAAFHAQQAAEKYLKAWLVHHQVEIPRTHDLGRLVHMISSQDEGLSRALEPVDQLTPFAVEYRYPGNYEPVSASDASKALEIAQSAARQLRAVLADYL